MACWFNALLLAALALMPAPASAECGSGKFAELPAAMANCRRIVTMQFDGRDARSRPGEPGIL